MRRPLYVVHLICCDHDDGTYGPTSWARADALRRFYLAGPRATLDAAEHHRRAIIEDTEGNVLP